MPQRDPGVYLDDIEHYAAAAVRFTTGFSREQYLADETLWKQRAAQRICTRDVGGLA